MKRCLTPLIALLVLIACSRLREPAKTFIRTDKILLADTSRINGIEFVMASSVRSFYGKHHLSLFWIDSLRRNAAADSLLEFIKGVEAYGLDPLEYHYKELARLTRDSLEQNLIKAELLFTDAYFTLRHHLQKGRVDALTHERIELQNVVDSAGINVLGRRRNLISALDILQPRSQDYTALKDSLSVLLALPAPDSTDERNITQIKLNMERCRWRLPYPERYVLVNIPAFLLWVVEADSVVLQSNVIVGRPETTTPVLESAITSFLIYPYWNVPRGIAVNEILPSIKKDSAYLSRHRYEVLDKNGNVIIPDSVNWQGLNANFFPYTLRQRDGYENSLGIIKFNFSNPYNVYLHDTNARKLFSRKMRALSHGCVRVQKAVELAHYLVKDDSVYVTPDDLDQYLSLQQRYAVKVRKPIPVIITYLTCGLQNGKLVLYEDVYGLDEKLKNVIASPVVSKDLTLAAR